MEEKMIAIKKIIAVGGVLLGTAGIVHAYLRTAPSKAAREFTDLAEDLLKGTEPAKGRFTEADIATLPGPVRRHLRRCGHLGKPKMAYMKAAFPDVAFSLGKGKIPSRSPTHNIILWMGPTASPTSTVHSMAYLSTVWMPMSTAKAR